MASGGPCKSMRRCCTNRRNRGLWSVWRDAVYNNAVYSRSSPSINRQNQVIRGPETRQQIIRHHIVLCLSSIQARMLKNELGRPMMAFRWKHSPQQAMIIASGGLPSMHKGPFYFLASSSSSILSVLLLSALSPFSSLLIWLSSSASSMAPCRFSSKTGSASTASNLVLKSVMW